MRLDSSGNNTTGTSGRVIRIQNGGGNPGDEAYTHGFFSSQTTSLTWANCVTPNDGQWCITWYGRKSTGAGNSGTVRQTVFALGCKYDGTNLLHMNFASATSGGSASSGTLSSPKTGGTYYHSQRTLTTSWTKYTMHFKFNGDTNVNYIALRFDNDDGVALAGTIFTNPDLGEFSWGKIDLGPRFTPQVYTYFGDNGAAGLSTCPLITRQNRLAFKEYQDYSG
jgi:hypothetical protein